MVRIVGCAWWARRLTLPASFDVCDLDGDGLRDLVLANQGGTLRISLF